MNHRIRQDLNNGKSRLFGLIWPVAQTIVYATPLFMVNGV